MRIGILEILFYFYRTFVNTYRHIVGERMFMRIGIQGGGSTGTMRIGIQMFPLFPAMSPAIADWQDRYNNMYS